ncbi:MAG: acyl--CoA ligase [Candidatus Kapabacteria bacterium]|nr:acyl--CoA ligase [Candidatus Kapabacteria bacterium]
MSYRELISQAHTSNGVHAADAPYSFKSIADALLHHAAAQPDARFLVYYDESGRREEYSYKQFAHTVASTISLYRNNGIGSGDRIITAGHNHPDTIIQYVAAWCCGACVVPLNMTEDDNRLAYIMRHSAAKLIVARDEYSQRINHVVPDGCRIIPVDAAYHATLESLGGELDSTPASMLDNEALIVYTSGTTGNPKGVVLVQRNLIADADGIIAWHSLKRGETMMCVLPVHHVNGAIVTHVTPLIAGASVVLQRKFQPSTFFTRAAAERVNIISVVPTLLAYLLEAGADESGAKANGLRHIICGAGPLSCELARKFESRYSIPVLHGYGLSETTCYSCFLETNLTPDAHNTWMFDYGFPSIGTPIPQNEMAIHNDKGEPLGEGERGEIVIRGWNVMKEYYDNPAANESAFAYGWFRSGDEGFYKLSHDGKPYFFITGRIKELIIRGGVNLAPLEIDEVLAAAPGVKAAICVGFENEYYGEEIGALVISDGTATEQGILDYCQSTLPFGKSPKIVVFTDELPVTSTGKYQRNKVKHLFAEWKNTQFKKH